ncbi:MAG TPA: NAD(P)-binding domain-containing protein [Actinotalea sp.]
MARVAEAYAPARVKRVEVLEVGAGQAGVATAHHLHRAGLEPYSEFVVLDDASAPGGAWQRRREGLTVDRAWGIRPLPGLALPDVGLDVPASTALPAYLAAYEATFDLPVVRPVRVRRVEEAGGGLLSVETDGGTWLTRGLVSATGTWHKPFWPSWPGQGVFAGRQLHSRDVVRVEEFAGQHVVVVGAGMSAVTLLVELAGVATTTWVSRRPPVVVEPDDGTLRRLPMFERLVADGAVWSPVDTPPAPEHVRADVVVWATGFRPALDHLTPLHLRGRGGSIALDGPQVVADPRLQLVGYGPGAGEASADDTARAGRTAVRNLRRLLGF